MAQGHFIGQGQDFEIGDYYARDEDGHSAGHYIEDMSVAIYGKLFAYKADADEDESVDGGCDEPKANCF